MHAAIEDRAPAKAAGSTPVRPQSEQALAQQNANRDDLASLVKEHAQLSARAAQARGRGEWALAAQIASRLAPLAEELLRAAGTPKSHNARLLEAA